MGSLGGIYSAMEGEEKEKESSWCLVHNYTEIPSAVTHSADAISCAGFNPPAVPRESRSVTEQINGCCFLSRLDRPVLTAEAVILAAHAGERSDGAPARPPDLWTPSIRSGTQITWLHA